ncbi:hypothetical protein C6Y45_13745 [Alkalicoccus saliphilus]|uniref:Uncharacterized protein n=1 Tax=Alkalicoccus saliphilus TaxID=200989 RepID=A0A2T4U3K3_9BACI|nr:hypothetical protein C6Y45_13745 [Alkalicoccus saliphilus]
MTERSECSQNNNLIKNREINKSLCFFIIVIGFIIVFNRKAILKFLVEVSVSVPLSFFDCRRKTAGLKQSFSCSHQHRFNRKNEQVLLIFLYLIKILIIDRSEEWRLPEDEAQSEDPLLRKNFFAKVS